MHGHITLSQTPRVTQLPKDLPLRRRPSALDKNQVSGLTEHTQCLLRRQSASNLQKELFVGDLAGLLHRESLQPLKASQQLSGIGKLHRIHDTVCHCNSEQ
jgi:hypothetical protein